MGLLFHDGSEDAINTNKLIPPMFMFGEYEFARSLRPPRSLAPEDPFRDIEAKDIDGR